MLTRQLLKIVQCFARTQSTGEINVSVSLRKGKKADRDLQMLKRSLMEKEPVKSQSLYQEYHHRDVYQRIDTDLESFFYKRQYTLENFNFLINLLGHQKKLSFIPDVINKMHIMNIVPDERTYNYMIKAASEEGNIDAAQNFLKQASEKFGVTKHFYTSLMQVYSRKNNPEMAYKILQQMIEKGIQPDLPVYTSVINAFRLGRKLEKCWQINKLILKNKMQLDETYVGVMLKVHAATHDAQKAVKLYQDVIIGQNIKPMLQTLNSYFKALSTRPDYSIRVIDKVFNMIENGDIINEQTIRWALRACATTANVKSAVELVKIMKLKEIQPNVHIYNSLIRVYANACSIPTVSEKERQLMLTDTWKLLEEVINKNMLDTPILNNVILAHANALQQEKIEGLILPLFQKFKLEMDPYTYEILVDMSYQKKDFNTAIKVWNQMKLKFEEKKQKQIAKYGVYQTNLDQLKQDRRPTFNLLQTYIQIGIRMMNMQMVLQGLQMFKKLGRHPKNSTLKFLGNLKNLPIQIQTSLMQFKIRFGAAKLAKTRSNSEKSVKDPQNQ